MKRRKKDLGLERAVGTHWGRRGHPCLRRLSVALGRRIVGKKGIGEPLDDSGSDPMGLGGGGLGVCWRAWAGGRGGC